MEAELRVFMHLRLLIRLTQHSGRILLVVLLKKVLVLGLIIGPCAKNVVKVSVFEDLVFTSGFRCTRFTDESVSWKCL